MNPRKIAEVIIIYGITRYIIAIVSIETFAFFLIAYLLLLSLVLDHENEQLLLENHALRNQLLDMENPFNLSVEPHGDQFS